MHTDRCDCDVIHHEVVQAVEKTMLDLSEYQHLASLFKMFADSTRVRLLYALMQQELCVCDLAVLLGMTKSAVSHQLKSLRLSNLVKSRRAGQVVYYSLADDHVRTILNIGLEHTRE